jgi:hypothetical protein
LVTALEHAIELEPEIVMQAPGGVFLNDESVALRPCGMAARLGGDVELAFLPIDLQSHEHPFPDDAKTRHENHSSTASARELQLLQCASENLVFALAKRSG